MPVLFDAHCHATRKTGAPPPGPGSPPRRRIVCGVSPADWPVIGDWAENWPGTTPAFGVHPWEAESPNGDWESGLERLLARFPRAWVGEIGLDAAKRGRAPMARQLDVLARQLRLAARLRRPVNLHCVRAAAELLAALDKEYFPSGAKKCILHSFGGPPRAALEFAARGAYFSIGPRAAGSGPGKARDLVRLLPEEGIVLESDAFLEPGVDAEAALPPVLRWLAEARGTAPETLAQHIADNARRLLDDAD